MTNTTLPRTGNTTSNGFREMALCLELIQSGTLNRDQLGVIWVAVEQQMKKKIESVQKSGRKYYTPKEAAAIMGVSRSMIYKLTAELGELDYNKVGRATRIPIQALDEYIEKSKEEN